MAGRRPGRRTCRYGHRYAAAWRSLLTGRSGDPAEVPVLQPVGVAFEGDDFGVVDEPVDHRCGDDVVAEHLTPPAERLVGSDDEGGPLVAGADELEEQVGGFGLERDVADFVDDDQRVAAQPDQFGLQLPGVVGVAEPRYPVRGTGELDPVPGLARSYCQ